MDSSDEDLLRQYAREGSDAAFRELVRRHVNLVYSAAKRQLHSDALASDVTQSVFTDLAKAASTFKSSQPVIAWLYLVTRRTAIDTIRRESRRQERERTTLEIADMKTDPSIWAQIAPFLDEALETLSETDRQAILLRYFANKSLREVGKTLGTSDDAAQKRVSRALEQLRTIFVRRGLAVTAAGLATDLSANAILSVPSELGTSVSTGAISSALLAQTTNTIAMTALNKTLVAASLLLAASLVYQSHLLATGRSQMLGQEHNFAERQLQSQQLDVDRDRVMALLEKKHKELESGRNRAKEGDATQSELGAWLDRVSRLNDLLEKMPEKKIPEMRFLGFSDWLAVTLNNGLETEAKVTLALADLRRMAKLKPQFYGNLPNAIRAYSKDHAGQPVTEVSQLKPYLNPALDDDILQRYEFVPVTASFWPERPATNGIGQSTLMEKAVVDEDYDILAEYSDGGVNVRIVSKLGTIMGEATSAFMKANKGQEPAAAEQLLPYVAASIDQAKFKEFWEARRK
jgi:RNA polymerase sigma factor (sigma-70 family)